jgi:hypothetical protein
MEHKYELAQAMYEDELSSLFAIKDKIQEEHNTYQRNFDE